MPGSKPIIGAAVARSGLSLSGLAQLPFHRALRAERWGLARGDGPSQRGERFCPFPVEWAVEPLGDLNTGKRSDAARAFRMDCGGAGVGI